MRESLNSILQFIGATSLTDEEWDSIDLGMSPTDQEVYEALLEVLNARSLVSSFQLRLNYYFKAKGSDFTEPSLASSNILVGATLAD